MGPRAAPGSTAPLATGPELRGGPIGADRELLERHVRVLFQLDEAGRIRSINEPDDADEPVPSVFVGRGFATTMAWVRADVPAPIAAACLEVAGELSSWNGRPAEADVHARVRAVVAALGLDGSETIGPAFSFDRAIDVPAANGAVATVIDAGSAELLERHFPYTRSVLAARSPVLGIVVDGAVVAACFSARSRPDACEAGIRTVEGYRGRGYGTAVTAAWRRAVEAGGRVPLYSTTWDNAASLGIARRLRLTPYAETFAIG